MAKRKPTEQQLREIREFAAQWGKIVARRFGPESGPFPLNLCAINNSVSLLLNQPSVRFGFLQCTLVLLEFLACGRLLCI